MANGGITDVAVLEGVTEYEVECVEDGFIEIGESGFISGSNFLVVDGGIAATHDDYVDDAEG